MSFGEPPVDNVPEPVTLTLSPDDVQRLHLHISDVVLQDAWFEMDDDEFDWWMGFMEKLGLATGPWRDRRMQMETEDE